MKFNISSGHNIINQNSLVSKLNKSTSRVKERCDIKINFTKDTRRVKKKNSSLVDFDLHILT